MFSPSGTNVSESELRIERVGSDLYVVDNAYDGAYEYFPGRPVEGESLLRETDLREGQTE